MVFVQYIDTKASGFGVLAIWWIISIFLIYVFIYWMRKEKLSTAYRQSKLRWRTPQQATRYSTEITIAGTCNAASFAIFQNIPLFGGFHVNLTPLICICGGTALGGTVVFIVDILSTAIRHGCGNNRREYSGQYN